MKVRISMQIALFSGNSAPCRCVRAAAAGLGVTAAVLSEGWIDGSYENSDIMQFTTGNRPPLLLAVVVIVIHSSAFLLLLLLNDSLLTFEKIYNKNTGVNVVVRSRYNKSHSDVDVVVRSGTTIEYLNFVREGRF